MIVLSGAPSFHLVLHHKSLVQESGIKFLDYRGIVNHVLLPTKLFLFPVQAEEGRKSWYFFLTPKILGAALDYLSLKNKSQNTK